LEEAVTRVQNILATRVTDRLERMLKYLKRLSYKCKYCSVR